MKIFVECLGFHFFYYVLTLSLVVSSSNTIKEKEYHTPNDNVHTKGKLCVCANIIAGCVCVNIIVGGLCVCVCEHHCWCFMCVNIVVECFCKCMHINIIIVCLCVSIDIVIRCVCVSSTFSLGVSSSKLH